MIAMLTSAWAGPLELGASGHSAGAMVSWRTTGPPAVGALGRWWEEEVVTETYVEPALHAIGSWRALNLDLSLGYEAGAFDAPRMHRSYAGFRAAARGSVTVVSTRAVGAQIDPLNLSVGVGVIGWASCCSSQGSSTVTAGGPPRVDAVETSATVFAAERLWLWGPVGVDLRYEVPLSRPGFRNTLSVGVVFAGRK